MGFGEQEHRCGSKGRCQVGGRHERGRRQEQGEENMVLEVPKVEDNEECDEVDSGTTNSNDQPLFPLFPVDDCVQIDKSKFAVVGDDDELKGSIERE
ncbi:hypothetical protein U1Q18_005274 [Sarracenia purpurea var. burkii]